MTLFRIIASQKKNRQIGKRFGDVGTGLLNFYNFESVEGFRGATGADERTRTSGPRFTKPLLYQLSYIGTKVWKFYAEHIDRTRCNKHCHFPSSWEPP